MVKNDDYDDYDEDEDRSGKSKGNGKDTDEIHIEVLDPDSGASLSTKQDLTTESVEQIEKLEKQLEKVSAEKAELYDKLLRKAADFENYRKRTDKEKREQQQYALADFMSELIHILDNFERSFAHSDEESNPEYRKGVELIYRQLRDLMEKKGLRAIQVEGEVFDPNLHEAILREERDDLPDNTVLEELQKGYFFRDKLLRPALVKVSFRPKESEQE